MPAPAYPCPCCGAIVFVEAPGSYEIGPVCGWEDDLSQLRFPTTGGGANAPSLLEAQRRHGASPTRGGVAADPGWRPLDPSRDVIEVAEPGRDYGSTYASDGTTYYYWRAR
jgi:Cysteine-rich CPCC